MCFLSEILELFVTKQSIFNRNLDFSFLLGNLRSVITELACLLFVPPVFLSKTDCCLLKISGLFQWSEHNPYLQNAVVHVAASRR